MQPDTITTVITQLPNFAGLLIAIGFAWRVIQQYHALVNRLLDDMHKAEKRASDAEVRAAKALPDKENVK